MQFKQQAIDLFKSYPTHGEFSFTADGQAFFSKGNAEAHGKGLSDKTVVTITRAEAEAEDEDAEWQKQLERAQKKLKAQYAKLEAAEKKAADETDEEKKLKLSQAVEVETKKLSELNAEVSELLEKLGG